MIETREGIIEKPNYSEGEILNMLRDLPDACCVFELIADPFGTVRDMQFVFANQKYASLVGKTTAELVGSNYYDTVSNRDEDWIRLSYQAAIMRQSVINRTYNTQFGKWFEFWAVPVYKKGYCAFIIHDVTAEQRKEKKSKIATKSNNIIIECAKVLSSYEFKVGIKKALEILGKALSADRVFIIEDRENEVGEIHEWVDRRNGTGLPSKKEFEERDFFTMWRRQLNGEDIKIVEDTKIVEAVNKEVYDEVLAGTITRYILATLSDKNKILGYLIIDNQSPESDIDVKEVVESVAIFISEEIRNSKLTREMRYMTTHDILTDLGNRNSFNSQVHMLEGLDVPVGVCFIDINGLKLVNDTNGHDAGDTVIKESADIISTIFKKKHCYRIGGDEFVVIAPQMSQKTFEQNVEKLKRKQKNVQIALGSVWSETCTNITELVNTADSLMYDDKAEYYKKNDRRKE